MAKIYVVDFTASNGYAYTEIFSKKAVAVKTVKNKLAQAQGQTPKGWAEGSVSIYMDDETGIFKPGPETIILRFGDKPEGHVL